jgi:hypothetical protein
MDGFILKGNIERFERKLRACRDDTECRVQQELLSPERQRLSRARQTGR